jgi:futalosine hydrolase
MNLLIVAATEFEIGPFLKENIPADILITGIGIPATIFHLTKKLFEKKYDLAIQAGIAGSFNHLFKLSEVVAVKEEAFADLGIEEKGRFYSLFEKGFIDKNEFPFENGWLKNEYAFVEKINLLFAKGITVNKIGDDILQNKMIKENFLADVESMEGAAFHYVCLHQKINFLQLRSISNYVGERDRSKWELHNAIESLSTQLLKIIEKL